MNGRLLTTLACWRSAMLLMKSVTVYSSSGFQCFVKGHFGACFLCSLLHCHKKIDKNGVTGKSSNCKQIYTVYCHLNTFWATVVVLHSTHTQKITLHTFMEKNTSICTGTCISQTEKWKLRDTNIKTITVPHLHSCTDYNCNGTATNCSEIQRPSII